MSFIIFVMFAAINKVNIKKSKTMYATYAEALQFYIKFFFDHKHI